MAIAERLLEAARRGHIRCVAIAIVNPLHEHEIGFAGSADPTHRISLIGALAKLSRDILGLL